MPIDPDTGLENWDCPDSFNVTKMYQSLNYTREHNGQLSNDHPRGEDSNTHDGSLTVSDSFLDQLRAMVPADVEEHTRLIIVDGILLFCDPLIYNEFDCSIFIHAGKETLKQRREARQGYITQEGYWVDPPGYFDQLVWPQYVKWNSHLFPDGNHTELNPNTIKDLLVMNSDNESIEQIATAAVKALLGQLQ
ncbi:ribosylnicotinamide kinase [Umbelopsis nana]